MSFKKLRKAKAKPAKKKKATRRRRSATEAKAEILSIARNLLLQRGPDALTLTNLAKELGTSHSNVLHHFGTAGDLHIALMGAMVHDLAGALDDAVAHLRSDAGAPRELVEMVFDAFEKGGAGRLAAWIILSDNLEHLEPMQQAVNDLLAAVEEKFMNVKGDRRTGVTSAVLFLAMMAFGDSMIGGMLRDMMDRERASVRKIATHLLPQFFIPKVR